MTSTTPDQSFTDAMKAWEAALNRAAVTGEIVSLTDGIILAEREHIRMHKEATDRTQTSVESEEDEA